MSISEPVWVSALVSLFRYVCLSVQVSKCESVWASALVSVSECMSEYMCECESIGVTECVPVPLIGVLCGPDRDPTATWS